MVLFPCWLLSSLPLPELEAVVTVEAAIVEAAVVIAAIVEVAVVVESVLSPGQTSVQ